VAKSKILSRHLDYAEGLKNTKNLSENSRSTGRFEPGASRKRNRSVDHSIMAFGKASYCDGIVIITQYVVYYLRHQCDAPQ
jgi:hypothetical protein